MEWIGDLLDIDTADQKREKRRELIRKGKLNWDEAEPEE